MSDDRTISSNFVDVDGLRLHWNEAGEGEPLVLLHGGGPGSFGLSNYSRNVQPLAAAGYRVMMLDLPGYGRSDKPLIREPLWGYMARAVAGFLDALGIPSAHIVGNSLGGATALKAALDYPDKVGRLVLMGPGGGYATLTASPTVGIQQLVTFYHPPGPSIEKLRGFVQQLVYDPKQVTDDILEERLRAAGDGVTADNFPLGFRPGDPTPIEDLWRERLDRLPHETLIVWGREDRVNPLDQGMILMRQIPNARLLVLPKCGHWAQWEKADEFNREVRGFLGS